MSQHNTPQYSFSWNSYQSNICNGFSSFQQNGEFVDMTLAADGHMVKVHQLIMALASPYLKQIMASAPCQHPVIFLNNVSYKTLCNILEYIYTGEVVVRNEDFQSFVDTAKSLHIKGLDNITNTTNNQAKKMIVRKDTDVVESSGHGVIKRLGIHTRQGLDEVGLPTSAKKICIKQESPNLMRPSDSFQQAYTDTTMDDSRNDSDGDDPNEPFDTSLPLMTESSTAYTDNSATDGNKATATNLQFTVSNRGSLQIILNRYLYNLHSTSHKINMRRWRCVNYRNERCPAFVVTKGNIVVNRGNLHTHPFHDKKILAKIERQAVYSALDEVEAAKDAEKKADEEMTEEKTWGT